MKKKQPNISEEDLSLWQEATKEVQLLSSKTEEIERPAPILPPIRNSIDNTAVYHGNKLNDLAIGQIADLDRNTATKFKRGEFKIERRLDLHGYTEDEAWEAVINFVKNAYIDNLRCILIVTGKGSPHPEDEDIMPRRGILKEKVPQWLNSRELRPLILSISYSQIKDGGEGALYVLLRRKR